MSRFSTARAVFDAFPQARGDITVQPTDDPPLAFLKSLIASATPENAVAFLAYLLPRREAVWWACQCIRTLNPSRNEGEEAALQAAEAWVREPEEEQRRAALQLAGDSADQGAAATWLAYSAGWSGGSMTTSDPPVPAPPHLTAKAVRVAVLMALARIPVKQRRERLGACLTEGVRLVDVAAGPKRA